MKLIYSLQDTTWHLHFISEILRGDSPRLCSRDHALFLQRNGEIPAEGCEVSNATCLHLQFRCTDKRICRSQLKSLNSLFKLSVFLCTMTLAALSRLLKLPLRLLLSMNPQQLRGPGCVMSQEVTFHNTSGQLCRCVLLSSVFLRHDSVFCPNCSTL